ncbi:MAG: hypothetical protein CL424_19675 [Acidimicrobiaceae bacterium]|nr:hypothetical protein [Acidimicrobiaceae bacterium]
MRRSRGAVGQALYRAALAARYALPPGRPSSFGAGTDSVTRIYVVNLDRQTHRWEQVQRELARLHTATGAPFTDLVRRVAAVDARYEIEASPEIVQSVYTLADQLFVDRRLLPPSIGDPADVSIEMSAEETAIALSHVRVWRLIAEGEHPYSLVLEDDVYFSAGFSRTFDRTWSSVVRTAQSPAFDLLLVSYEEARSGAEWTTKRGVRQPVRGVWQMSGYVLSKPGAQALLDHLPVRGPVDLWINTLFRDIHAFALERPVVRQRQDVPSSNYYSALPILARVGLISDDTPQHFERRGVSGPVFGYGQAGSGLTALAMALSMLKYRCYSDIYKLPPSEAAALFGCGGPRVFDAYVNVGDLGPVELVELARIYPQAKFIFPIRSVTESVAESIQPQLEGIQCELSTIPEALRALAADSSRSLVLRVGYGDMWRVLTEFLESDYPSDPYPTCTDQGQRAVSDHLFAEPQRSRCQGVRLPWDALPWVANDQQWRGVSLEDTMDCSTARSEVMRSPGTSWVLRRDTFPSNLAMFHPSNFEMTPDGGGRLVLKRERSSVRSYTSAALTTRDAFRYGRFAAVLMPARVSGVVTGMFLHRNSPRQEIDIEFVGRDTSKMLINVYYNPGDIGSRQEHGYRGTPETIDLGFDAADGPHEYEIEWTPERVSWFVDQRLVHRREHWDPTPIPRLPMQFHVNLWPTRSTELAGRLRHRALPCHAHLGEVRVTSPYRTPSSEPSWGSSDVADREGRP